MTQQESSNNSRPGYKTLLDGLWKLGMALMLMTVTAGVIRYFKQYGEFQNGSVLFNTAIAAMLIAYASASIITSIGIGRLTNTLCSRYWGEGP